jgi:hypothetical protein
MTMIVVGLLLRTANMDPLLKGIITRVLTKPRVVLTVPLAMPIVAYYFMTRGLAPWPKEANGFVDWAVGDV